MARSASNAASAAAVLRNAMTSGFDPVKLAALNHQQGDELARNLARTRTLNDRGQVVNDPNFYSGATLPDLHSVEDDIANDPYTGVAAQQHQSEIEDALRKAGTSTLQPIEDASDVAARRNAFGKFLEGVAKHQADVSTEGQAALDAEERRKIAEANAASGSKLNGQIALMDAKGVTPNAASTSSLTALDQIESLAPQVLQRLREAHPGIETDPSQYGGVGDTLLEKGKRFAYGIGLYKPNEDIGQLTQLLRTIAARPYMNGRPNQRVYDDIVSHLGEFGFSPGADYARISKVLSLTPDLRQAIYSGSQPIPRVSPTGNVIADPNWGAQP